MSRLVGWRLTKPFYYPIVRRIQTARVKTYLSIRTQILPVPSASRIVEILREYERLGHMNEVTEELSGFRLRQWISNDHRLISDLDMDTTHKTLSLDPAETKETLEVF